MERINRRDFLKYSGTGLAGLAIAIQFPFLGTRKAFAKVGVNSFTIAVISDTQYYADYTHQNTIPPNLTYYTAQTRYLSNNKSEMRLAFVTHVGDVVQHGDGTNGKPGDKTWGAGEEWDNAVKAMDILAATGVPFGMCPGNHDYDNYSHSSSRKPLVSTVMWKNISDQTRNILPVSPGTAAPRTAWPLIPVSPASRPSVPEARSSSISPLSWKHATLP